MKHYETGSTFGPYTIEGLVAGGGMGRVYAARHEVYKTPVALKVLHPKLHKDPSWMKRFSVEGLVGTRLKHPNILSARELVSHDGRIALVMDLVSGGQTLEKVISREHKTGLPLVQALQVFLAIVQGVEYLHGKAIVHGDMKPENVLVDGDYRDPDSWSCLVTDFGTVTLIADPVTIDGKPAVVATPRYASPEHLYGVDQIIEISDVYALGLVLHFLITGQHASTAKTVAEAAKFVRQDIPVVALVDQPDSLIALYQKATMLDPVERYADCRELALAVREILDEVGAPLELDDLQADLATEIDEQRAEKDAEAAEETELDLGGPVSPEQTTAAASAPEPVPPEVDEEPDAEAMPVQPQDEGSEASAVDSVPEAEAEPEPDAKPDAEVAPDPVPAPVPADRVDPDDPAPIWLWAVIAGVLGFFALVIYQNWV